MKAINQLDHEEILCFPADDVIRNFEPRAEYWFECKTYTVILTPSDKIFDSGQKYRHYTINGKMHESTISAPYERLKQLIKRKYENVTFEFVEVEDDDD